MRRALFAVLCLCALLVARAHAAVSFVAGVSAGSSDGTAVTTGSIDTSGANLLVVCRTNSTANTPTPTDSKSNTYTGIGSAVDAGSTNTRCYYNLGGTVGSGHTFSVSSGSSFPCVTALAFSGVKTSSPLDQTSGTGTATVSSIAPGSATPSENNEVVVVGFGTGDADYSSINGSFTVPMGGATTFVNAQHWGCGAAYLIQTTAAAANPTVTFSGLSVEGDAVLATFKQQAGGGSGGRPTRRFFFGV